MRFGPVAVADAAGAILAHGVHHEGGRFAKGRVLGADDIAALARSGIETITVARLDEGDVGEDAAASRVAARLAGPNLIVSAAYTGRVNLFAAADGLALVEASTIHALNRVHEAVTIATLPPFTPVLKGQMIATIKIIPFAVAEGIISNLEWMLAGTGPISLSPWAGLSAGLIQTILPGTKPNVLDKSVAVTTERLAGIGGNLAGEVRVPHAVEPLAAALRAADGDIVLVIGASAITDRRDVVPAAIEAAGGCVLHVGMPVDPGNLLLLGELDGRPVLGLPGCARSPKLNGVDWVLQRLGAGLPVDAGTLMGMGVGGLLAEISGRPMPRALATSLPRAPRIAGLVLAGGFGRRMGGGNKLLHVWQGKPLVRHVADAALAAQLAGVTVATGHQAGDVRAALDGLGLDFAHALDHGDGLSATLKAGLAALPEDVDGVIVLLGDMPRVTAGIIDRLVAAFSPTDGRGIIVPTCGGQRGNPVLWDRAYIAEMMALTGDAGAKSLIAQHKGVVCEVAVEDAGVLLDVDTPEALAAL
ncbi:NTP transferase domain-containing protein [Niveispirillum sp. KHB5.9]|uniref:NTP transferase domain-containing protein n=1 Tax=Niveispirillum sp. KHB5.9 TaxID=3400269 RepID=UPI003A87FF4F